jgi:hypothetical protein
MSPEPARQHYVARVIDLYCALPDTTGRARPADRRLAAALCDRGIRLEIIEDALLLASGRRSLRAPDALPLAPVRSLHYFLGVIDELLQTPLPAGYRDYLQRKLRNRKNWSSEPRPS